MRFKKEFKKALNTFEKVIDDAIEDTKKIIDTAEDALERFAKKSGHKIDGLRTDWNQWREKNVDKIGDFIELIYESFKDGSDEFPPGFERNPVSKIENSSIICILSATFINKVTRVYFSNSIPLEKDNPNSNKYIHIKNFNVEFDQDRNIFVFNIKDGVLGYELPKVRAGIKIQGARVEVALKTIKQNRKIVLEVHIRIPKLDLDETPPFIERAIAQGLYKTIFSKGPIAMVDITENLKAKIPFVNREKTMEFEINNSCIYVVHNGFKIEMSILKQFENLEVN